VTSSKRKCQTTWHYAHSPRSENRPVCIRNVEVGGSSPLTSSQSHAERCLRDCRENIT
jgi:hypothetical protein